MIPSSCNACSAVRSVPMASAVLLAAVAVASAASTPFNRPMQQAPGVENRLPVARVLWPVNEEESGQDDRMGEEDVEAEEVPKLAPLARQIDLLHLILSGGAPLAAYNGYESEDTAQAEAAAQAEEMKRLARSEMRRRILQRQEEIRQLQQLRQQQQLQRQQPVATAAGQRPKRRGSCLFHAGLAHNCDYRDVVSAVNEASHWGSDTSPGRK